MNNAADIRNFQKLLLTCCLVSFACNLGSYMRIPVAPLFARTLGADAFQVGLINSSFLFMAGLLSLPMGILSDRMGRKRFIISGALISAASSLLLYICGTPAQMIWVYLFFGIGLAAFNPTMMSYVADISPVTHLGRAYGWYTMALYGGMALGPAAGGYLGHAMGFRPVFLISGVFIFLMSWLVVLFLPGSPHSRESRSEPASRPSFADLLANRTLLGCWLGTLGSCFGYGTFMTFVPLHANDLGMNAGDIGLIFAVQALSNAFCRIPFGQLSDRSANRGHMAVAGFLLFAVSLAGFGFFSRLALFLFCSVAAGTGMGMIFISLGALVSEVVPRESRGLAMGGYNTCIYLGMMSSSFVMGLVIRGRGFVSGFLITALITVVTAVLFHFTIRNYKAGKEFQ